MTDEAAGSRGPATTGAEPSQDAPAPSAPDDTPTARLDVEQATAQLRADAGAEPSATPPHTAPQPPPAAHQPPPAPAAPAAAHQAPPEPPPAAHQAPPADVPPGPGAAGQQPPPTTPPWFGAGSAGDGAYFSRDKLIRPNEGRHVAGVCAAIGRATNTDPVLWRVLIAVLGFFGIGVLLYLVGWLAIPGEGDTGSPIESLLGRGRSQMSPVSVIILAAVTALTFAFVLNDGLRTTLLAGAVLAGAFVLVRRNSAMTAGRVPGGDPVGAPATAGGPTFPSAPPAAYAPSGQSPAAATAPAGEPVTAPIPAPVPPSPMASSTMAPPTMAPPMPPAPGVPGAPFAAPPVSGYRPPFAPHGPYAGPTPYPPGLQKLPPPPPPKPPRAPKPPRERSKLGRITFFLMLVALGVVGLVQAAGVSVQVSTYFAAALTVLALGLVAGAWVGRARGLIVLGLLTAMGLGAASASEEWGGRITDNVWRPLDIRAVADRYETTVGDATLDLRAVDFDNQDQETTVQMRGGRLQVMLPPTVDVVATVGLEHGRARVFDREWDGPDMRPQVVTNVGLDGPGGGKLRLNVIMEAGDVEVIR